MSQPDGTAPAKERTRWPDWADATGRGRASAYMLQPSAAKVSIQKPIASRATSKPLNIPGVSTRNWLTPITSAVPACQPDHVLVRSTPRPAAIVPRPMAVHTIPYAEPIRPALAASVPHSAYRMASSSVPLSSTIPAAASQAPPRATGPGPTARERARATSRTTRPRWWTANQAWATRNPWATDTLDALLLAPGRR